MLIRYPGSKDSHLKFLSPHLVQRAAASRKLCEPFAGTAAVTFHLLQQSEESISQGREQLIESWWINDIDPSMAALWEVISGQAEGLDTLRIMIDRYTPQADDFYDFKANPGTSKIELAFRKIVLHQISYSGLGGKAGSPIGGRAQTGKYLVDCRWNATRLLKKIDTCTTLLQSAPGKVTNLSWKDVLVEALQDNFFVYLDPPYYKAGGGLYINGLIDHQDLADTLKNSDNKNWFLSYDDEPGVSELYSWAIIKPEDVRSHLHHKKISDVMITPVLD